MVQRLVIIPVKENQIAAPEHRIGDDLVGCAGAVKNEICFIGPKDPRGITLGFHRRTLVDK